MMLDHIGELERAQRIRDAIAITIVRDGIRTRDLGGTASTVGVRECCREAGCLRFPAPSAGGGCRDCRGESCAPTAAPSGRDVQVPPGQPHLPRGDGADGGIRRPSSLPADPMARLYAAIAVLATYIIVRRIVDAGRHGVSQMTADSGAAGQRGQQRGAGSRLADVASLAFTAPLPCPAARSRADLPHDLQRRPSAGAARRSRSPCPRAPRPSASRSAPLDPATLFSLDSTVTVVGLSL